VRTIIAAGGTGGHLFPALALAEKLREKGVKILFAGRKGGMEAKILREKGFAVEEISSAGFKRGFSLANFILPLIVAKGVWESFLLFRRFHPQVVVGTGGYVSLPVVLAAKAKGIPILLQEQNLLPGLANRLLAPLAVEVCLSFPASKAYLRGKLVTVPGNPVRRLRRWEKATARKMLGLVEKGKVILLLGGSQGAHSLNLALRDGLKTLLQEGINLIWQTGKGDQQWASKMAQPGVKVASFFEDMGLVYSAADLVISRAGGSTIAELTLLGKPSILIPYPFATGGHQRLNAQAFQQRGAALVIADADLNGKSLIAAAIPLLRDGERLQRMATASARLGQPQAAEALTTSIIRLAHVK